jgi:hypothetical protein
MISPSKPKKDNGDGDNGDSAKRLFGNKGINSYSSSFELEGKVWPYIISMYPT